MTVRRGPVGGTIHYVVKKDLKKGLAACLMRHKDMSWTDNRNESTCPQCLDATRPQVPMKGQAHPKKVK